MTSGKIYSVNSNQTVLVAINGKSEPEKKEYKYPKGITVQEGDTVAIDNVNGSDRIIAVY